MIIYYVLIIISFLIILEILLHLVIFYFRKNFQWLITEKDEYPNFDNIALEKFFKNSFDKELGWVRKPNSSGIEKAKHEEIKYYIDDSGSRLISANFTNDPIIATFGDSYTFCRQVKDNETWQYHLSNKINSKVFNFGVGNYGIDQALIYYLRKKLHPSVKIVIMGFVPETITRIQSYWKHYYEFGNTFAFKPRFTLKNNKLTLCPNLIKNIDDFKNISEIIDKVKEKDGFYKKKFIKLKFSFPYLFSFFRNLKRNTILIFSLGRKKIYNLFGIINSTIDNDPFYRIIDFNISDSHEMYKNEDDCNLLKHILLKFKKESYNRNHIPIILLMPQIVDLKKIDKNKKNPYGSFYKEMSKDMHIIDTTKLFLNEDINSLYVEDNYGGHFSEFGNKKIANKVHEYIYKNILK